MLRDVTPYNYEIHVGDRVTLRVERVSLYDSSSSTLREYTKTMDVISEHPGTGEGRTEWLLRDVQKRSDGLRQSYKMGPNQLSLTGRDARGKPFKYEIIQFVKIEKGVAVQGLGSMFGRR